MREYVIQHNNGRYACGPIAVLNALRFQGHRAKRRHLPWIADQLKVEEGGTPVGEFDRTGRRLTGFRRIRNPDWKPVEDQLKLGNAVIVETRYWAKSDGVLSSHVYMLAGIWIHRDNVSYYVCNLNRQCRWLCIEQIKDYYRQIADGYWFQTAWVVPQKRKKLRLA